MSCYKPYHAFITGELTESGKDKYAVVSNHLDSIEYKGYKLESYIEVPCRNCLGCRLDKARDWTARLLSECQYYEPSQLQYLTLTYDDAHLSYVPVVDSVDYETGEFVLNESQQLPTLVYRDVQLFMKRLRRNCQRRNRSCPSISFFCAGEYGPSTFRPHWHLIVFGLEFDDLRFYKLNKYGDPMYNSDFLDKAWQNGFATIEAVNEHSINYVARYCSKKSMSDLECSGFTAGRVADHIVSLIEQGRFEYVIDYYPDFLDYLCSRGFDLDITLKQVLTYATKKEIRNYFKRLFNIQLFETYGARCMCRRELMTSSKKPALGLRYYQVHFQEIYENDYIYLDHKKFRVPRYFDRLCELDHPDLFYSVRDERRRKAQLYLDEWYRQHPNTNRRIWLEDQYAGFIDKMRQCSITTRDAIESEVI